MPRHVPAGRVAEEKRQGGREKGVGVGVAAGPNQNTGYIDIQAADGPTSVSAMVRKVMAVPFLPARPVRPIRCVYASMLLGVS